MASTTLPLSDVVDVIVEVSPVAAAAPTFNQGLISGNSPVIPNSERLREYSSLAQVQSDFGTNAPEYKASQLYFGQSPPPQYLWIGLQDATAIQTVTVGDSGGTGYATGDILTVVQSGASGGTVLVGTVTGGGVISSLTVLAQGTGYSIASGLTVTGGSGSGADVNITAVGETPLQSLQACRNANGSWYACMSTSAVDADHEAIAAWIEAATPVGIYLAAVQDQTVLSVLKAGNYNRTMSLYTTTQSGLFPNNIYAAAGVMGRAMGLNTGLANSYFTMKFKVITGVAAEPLTQSQVNAIEALNGNAFVTYANSYSWVEQGVMASGQYFDITMGLDMLASDIQYSLVNLLVSLPSVPQSNTGEAQLIGAVNSACERSKTRGFISPGIWNGQIILDLNPGTSLPNGYLCQAQDYSQQSTSDRDQRKAMPIYAAVIGSGAVHSLIVGVFLQQ